ncbi:MAG: nodulation protein NodH [Cypionkella sp.]
MTQFTSFVVFAEMRTGSNFLEANLNTLDGVTCHGEAFNPYLIGGEGKQEMFGIDMAGRDADPAGFLAAMRAQTKGLSGFRYFSDHDPRVFDLVMRDHSCAKVILTRNQLESFISWKIAKESDQWWLANTKHLKTVRPVFDLAEFNDRTNALHQFQNRLVNRLQVTGQTAFYIDYEDVRDLDVLNGLAAFLGVDGRLKALDFKFKKQNPEPIEDKVSNPAEMRASLATLDWFNQSQAPNFEPRRQGMVPQYVATAGAPLLFMPIKAAPENAIKKWLQSYGPLVQDFDRNSLRKWKAANVGLRSFTVVRHPLARAYSAYCDLLNRDFMPELRPYLKRVHKFNLPPKGKGFETEAEFRAGLLVFLELAKYMLAGRTELRILPAFATQTAILQGFSQVQSPDVVIRDDRLTEGLRFLTTEAGVALSPPPEIKMNGPYELASIYGEDLELAAQAAYARDYEGLGFRAWGQAAT